MKLLTRAAAILLALSSNAGPALAQDVRVTDGDTIKMGGVTFRIWGIDAPETHQACGDRWLGGVEASRKMSELVAGHVVTCESRGNDRYGRTIGLCRADGLDLGAEMVKAGMAYAFVRYSHDYVELEEQARAAGLGVHAHQCEKPWDWRAAHPR